MTVNQIRPRENIHYFVLFLFMMNLPFLKASERFSLRSHMHLRYTDKQDADDFISLRRLILFGTGNLSSNLNLSSRFILKTGNDETRLSDNRIYLLDLYLTCIINPLFTIQAGQFKPPFGWERFQPDYLMPPVERSQVIDHLIPDGLLLGTFVRDYGMQVSSAISSGLSWDVAVMEGNGANRSLTLKNSPLLVTRFYWNKVFDKEPKDQDDKSMELWVAYSWRNNQALNLASQVPGCDTDEFMNFGGIDQRLDLAYHSRYGPADLSCEYIRALFLNDRKNLTADGWFIQGSCFICKRFQIYFKYELFDPDKSIHNKFDIHWITSGINYSYDNRGGRVMLAYVHKQEEHYASANDAVFIQIQYFLMY